MTRDAVILAGGLGTRLAGVLADVPKALAPVAGRPFLDWQLEYLQMQPVDRVVLCVGHLAAQIVARYGERFGRLEIRYAREETPLGTGGAIRRAMTEQGLATAFVMNGDTLLPVALQDVAGRAGDDVVIAAREVDDVARYGVLTLVGERVTGFAEKARTGPGCVNAGVYWLRRDVFERWALPAAFSFEHELLAAHVAGLHVRAVVVRAPFIDIGTPDALAAAQLQIPALPGRHASPGATAPER